MVARRGRLPEQRAHRVGAVGRRPRAHVGHHDHRTTQRAVTRRKRRLCTTHGHHSSHEEAQAPSRCVACASEAGRWPRAPSRAALPHRPRRQRWALHRSDAREQQATRGRPSHPVRRPLALPRRGDGPQPAHPRDVGRARRRRARPRSTPCGRAGRAARRARRQGHCAAPRRCQARMEPARQGGLVQGAPCWPVRDDPGDVRRDRQELPQHGQPAHPDRLRARERSPRGQRLHSRGRRPRARLDRRPGQPRHRGAVGPRRMARARAHVHPRGQVPLLQPGDPLRLA